MFYRYLFILSIVTSLFFPSTSFALEITFRQTSEVKNDVILLGDIATMSEKTALSEALATQIVTAAPEPGMLLNLDSRAVIAKLEREHGALYDVYWKGSSAISVKRSSIVIDGAKIQTVIDKFLKENTKNLPDTEVSFQPSALPIPFHLPQGKLSWNVIPSSPKIIDSSSFVIIFKVDGRVRKNFSVRGKTRAIASVFVANSTFKYGDYVSADQVTLVRSDISKLENYTDSIEKIAGTVAKRTIRKGDVIDLSALELPPVIKRGELVKIIINHNGLLVTATGIARANGRKDEMIRVRNSSSNKLIHARVQAPGLVEVTL